MELDNFKNTWKKQKDESGRRPSSDEILKLLENRMNTFEHKIKWRDRFEVAACAIVIIIFAFFFFDVGSTWAKAGCLIIILAVIYISYKLISARRMKTYSKYDHTFSEHLQMELRKVKKQKKLLESIFWWYLLPIYTGIVFFMIGIQVTIYFKIGYLLAGAFVFIFIWWLNKKQAKTYLNPLINQIKQAIAFTEQEL